MIVCFDEHNPFLEHFNPLDLLHLPLSHSFLHLPENLPFVELEVPILGIELLPFFLVNLSYIFKNISSLGLNLSFDLELFSVLRSCPLVVFDEILWMFCTFQIFLQHLYQFKKER